MGKNKLYVLLLGLVVVLGCEKEYSVENQLPLVYATGTLTKDSTACKPVFVHGNYYYNTFLDSTNYVVTQVRVITPGYYVIKTNTANGFYFSDSGYFANTGIQQIQLKGTGLPSVPDSTDFTLFFGGDICSFSVNNIQDTSTTFGNAFFKLQGSPNSCSNVLVTGTYTHTIPTDSTNVAIVQVNVIKTGAYTINTNIVNGFAFSASGSFTKRGVQTVVLRATGTPLKAETSVFPAIASTGNCSFSIGVN